MLTLINSKSHQLPSKAQCGMVLLCVCQSYVGAFVQIVL